MRLLTDDRGLKRSSGFVCSAISGGGILIAGPDGYKYKIIPPISGRTERFVSVGLRVSDLPKSVAYWCGQNGMTSYPSAATPGGDGCPVETVGYAEEQVRVLRKSSLTRVNIRVLRDWQTIQRPGKRVHATINELSEEQSWLRIWVVITVGSNRQVDVRISPAPNANCSSSLV